MPGEKYLEFKPRLDSSLTPLNTLRAPIFNWDLTGLTCDLAWLKVFLASWLKLAAVFGAKRLKAKMAKQIAKVAAAVFNNLW